MSQTGVRKGTFGKWEKFLCFDTVWCFFECIGVVSLHFLDVGGGMETFPEVSVDLKMMFYLLLKS